MKHSLYTGFLALFISVAAEARPVGFADSYMFMTMNDHSEYSAQAMFSPTARDALGIQSTYLRDDDSWLHAATYNRLLYRHNESDAQTNLFLLTGAGVAQQGDRTDPAAFVGIEADWENRRLLTLYQNRLIASGAVDERFTQRVRVGVAPYIGDYGDLHTWFILQVDHHPEDQDDIIVTPIVRLFQTTVLGEFGISDDGDVTVNLTYQM